MTGKDCKPAVYWLNAFVLDAARTVIRNASHNRSQKAEQSAAFWRRVYGIVMFFTLPINGIIEFLNTHGTFIDSWNWHCR